MVNRKPSRRAVLKSGVAMSAGGLIAGCMGGGDNGSTMKIGTVYPRSGPYAHLAEDNETAVQMVVDAYNENGGINDTEIEVINRDSQLDPQAAIQTTRDLIQSEQVDLLLGPISTAVAEGMMSVIEQSEIILGNSDSAAPKLTEGNCNKYFFRFRSTTKQEAIPLGPWMYENLGETMSVYYSDYAWGQAGLDDYGGEFENAGGEVINSVAVPQGTSEHSEYISQIDTNADILFPVIGGTDASSFIDQANEFGILDEMEVAVPGGDFFGGNLDATEGLREGFIAVTPYLERAVATWDTEHHQSFIDEFQSRRDKPPSVQGGKAFAKTNQILAAASDAEFTSREDTDALIDALHGREFSADEFITTNSYIRSDNNQMIYDQSILRATDGTFEEVSSTPYSEFQDTSTSCEF